MAGLIGSSNSPVSGLAIITVLGAALLRSWSQFLVYLIYPIGADIPNDTFGHWEHG